MPEKIKQDICRIGEVGFAKIETFIQERIKTEQENSWAPMQKFQLETWFAFLKKVHVAISDKVVETGLFARMLIVAYSRPDIHIQEC